MSDQISSIASFLMELEKLKLVPRKAYVSDLSRHENSAEHSWHLAIGLLTIARELEIKIDISKAVILALIHDICEIDAGDISVFDPARISIAIQEHECIVRLSNLGLRFGEDLKMLWLEYEAQETMESRWVRVIDRLMPFIINLSTQGQTWRDQSISRSQVLSINEPVRKLAPEIYSWMLQHIENCVKKGWLHDA